MRCENDYQKNRLAHLMWLPVVAPERNRLRDVIRGSDAQVIKRAAKFLTLASEYAARRRPNPLREPLPTYADWLVRTCHLSRKDAETFAARENAECRAIAEAERRFDEQMPLAA